MSTFLTAIIWGFGLVAGLALGLVFIKVLRAIVAMPRELVLQKRRRKNALANRANAKRREEARQAKADALLQENSELAEVVAELTALKHTYIRGSGHIRERLLRQLRKLVPDEKVRQVFHERTRRAG
jgi:hypothetical protein